MSLSETQPYSYSSFIAHLPHSNVSARAALRTHRTGFSPGVGPSLEPDPTCSQENREPGPTNPTWEGLEPVMYWRLMILICP